MHLDAQEDVCIGKTRTLSSAILGGEITYTEHLPEGYAQSEKQYPVVYLMNAQSVSNFANACATIDHLSSERIPDVILIGICNNGVAGNFWGCPDDSGQLKMAVKFYNFLQQELIPEVNRKYRTNRYKILAGQSNSGLYVLHNLLIHPDLFDAYIIASPMLGWCPEYALNETGKFLESNRELKKKLYVNYGEMDYVEVLDTIKKFEQILEQGSPAGLIWKLEMISNDGHVPYPSLHNALLFFFSGCTITAEMRKYSISRMRSHFERLSEEYGFTVQPKGDVLFDMAINLKAQKKYDESIDWFNYLTGLYPGSALYFYGFGLTCYENGDLNAARDKFTESLKIEPGHTGAKSMLEKLDRQKQ